MQLMRFEMEQEKERILEGINIGDDGEAGKESVRDMIRRIYRENSRKQPGSADDGDLQPAAAHHVKSKPMCVWACRRACCTHDAREHHCTTVTLCCVGSVCTCVVCACACMCLYTRRTCRPSRC